MSINNLMAALEEAASQPIEAMTDDKLRDALMTVRDLDQRIYDRWRELYPQGGDGL